MRNIFAWIVIIAVAVAGLGLAWLNSEPVKIDFMYTSFEPPLALLISICVGFGILVGAIISAFMVLRLRRRISTLEREGMRASNASAGTGMRVIPLKTPI